MSQYVRSGTAIVPSPHAEIVGEIPPKTFQVTIDKRTGDFYLELVPSLVVPERIYGTARDDAYRVITTYLDRSSKGKGTGVLMTGGKGSGKTLTAKILSLELARRGVPTIIVSEPHDSTDFISFLSRIDQPIIVLFDEFEKTYVDPKKQMQLLSLFDGIGSSAGKLFLVTVNEPRGVNELFLNRPGRFFYHFEFDGLEEKFIREYCLENLDNERDVEDVVKLSSFYTDFNFDVLQAVVEEVNRFKQPVKECVRYLNTTPFHDKKSYKLAERQEFKYELVSISPKVFSPLTHYTYVTYKVPQDEDGGGGTDTIYLGAESIIDFQIDRVTYEIGELGRVVLVADDQFAPKKTRIFDLL